MTTSQDPATEETLAESDAGIGVEQRGAPGLTELEQFAEGLKIGKETVSLPVEEELLASARYIDLEAKLVAESEKQKREALTIQDPAAQREALATIAAESKAEIAELFRFLEFLRQFQHQFRIVKTDGMVNFPGRTMDAMPVKRFLADQNIFIEGSDLVMLSTQTNLESYLNLKRYGFGVERIVTSLVGGEVTTGVKLTYKLSEGKTETIFVVFGEKQKKPETATAPENTAAPAPDESGATVENLQNAA